MPEVNSKKSYYLGFALLGIGLLIFYKTYNPEVHSFFPKCPFLSITGLQCPGCGSQRAIHHILNGHLVSAIKQNAMLVIAIPYVSLGMFLDYKKSLSPKLLQLRNKLYGITAIWFILGLVVSFWIFRNISI
ncbi:DUF2752 domain-containing protein [Leeuwenhoekiella sp. MAR_2009_132]|uniref:DUF2752 domain-containing protein n=1 Tax=Leeuwenhoekiella sp. MAR_2009_132 TaxID=1392489 RepID=UPI00068BF7A0|nr:DUF2752 domain-containing protein [Leeuwenhoekiella sp. MAR_2009_132]